MVFVTVLLAGLHPALGTIEERSQFLLERLASQPMPTPGGSGKQPYGTVIAYLAASGGADPDARDYLANTPYASEIFFNSIMQVRALYMAENHLTGSERSAVLSIASDDANNWNNNGTENHRLMTWSSGYLLAQFFPSGRWRYGSETLGSTELMSRLRDRIIEVGRNNYRAGYSEFLSPTYQIYHVAPMLNLYDYAEDPEVRAVAEAFLVYHFGLLSLGSFQEIVLAPWSRNAGEMDIQLTGANTQWLLWLFWGHGVVGEFQTIDPTLPIVFFAVSDWRPPSIFDDIATRSVDFPYTARMQQTHWQWNPTRYVMRTTYQEELYAMSSGVVRHLPSAFQLDDSQFTIAWDGSASIRYITAFHPYWRSVQQSTTGGENDWRAPTSPFMQTGQHENTAIMLFDILAEDPWAGVGQWASSRDGPVIPLGQTRYPSYLGVRPTLVDNWVFLRDGPVYIGIKTLKDNPFIDNRNLPGYVVIKSRGTIGERWQTGFIFEIGTEAEFGSFEAFQSALLANPVNVDWESMTVDYTNARGDALTMTYAVYDPLDPNIPNHTVPTFSVNGTQVAYDETWPVMDSPWTRLDNQILKVTDSDLSRLSVDWSGTVPVFQTLPPLPPFTGLQVDFLPPLTIRYQSASDVLYTLEATTDLSGGWDDAAGILPNSGDGSEQSFVIDPLPDSSTFFRIRAE